MQTNKIQAYLKTKYKESSDFIIIGNNIYSKTSISFTTLNGVNDITPVKAVYFLSDNSKPFKLGYKLGICLTQN